MRPLLILLLYTPFLFAQTKPFPKEDFRPPLDIPMQLSGNFGELRSNHFHTGFDFRTQQKEGFSVYAVGDGYISRIKISSYGYGKAIYIDHPNGYTTLYGHLQKGYGKIEAYIRAEQYKQQSYEIEVFPKPGELVVKKGDTIAISGNTGGSEGPHLHFEFRDTKTEKIINPHYFGFDLKDTRPPAVSSLVAYPVSDSSHVNQSGKPIIIALSKQPDGTFISQKVSASGKIGFGFSGYDQDDQSWNNNGIFKAQSFVNGKESFGFKFDSLAFDQGRYINALIDFPRYKRSQQRVIKMFMETPFPLSAVRTDATNGMVSTTPGLSQLYKLEVSDFYDNKSTILVPIDYTPPAIVVLRDVAVSNYFVYAKKDAVFEKDGMSVFFPAGTFYEDFALQFDVKDSVMTVQDDYTPVHGNFSVSVKKPGATNPEKTFIASVSGKRLSYNATKYKDGVFTTWTKNLGGFTLAEDTTPPRITIAKPIEGKWITKQNAIDLRISDEMSGIGTYNGYLNGKWVLFEYEHKAKRIRHVFDEALLNEGANQLKVVVTDNVGNSAIFETQFFRSQQK
ncbi:M23 family metallopeptidase [Flavobacterium caeni]|uniref:Peptidase family M23 n=1 Tax=Flavobacterium caeni TaxID=490189 RepID=A0A1G5HM40_9FLAO|nr:M23 family metallopeptidase [Flavobacterium caeni]SCY64856.1 Peptidase family M23 [Flavobacterium caeni]